jgi:hypothetical protein
MKSSTRHRHSVPFRRIRPFLLPTGRYVARIPLRQRHAISPNQAKLETKSASGLLLSGDEPVVAMTKMIKRHVILNAGSKTDIMLSHRHLPAHASLNKFKRPLTSFSGFTHQQTGCQLIICFLVSGIDSCRVPNAIQRHSCAQPAQPAQPARSRKHQ